MNPIKVELTHENSTYAGMLTFDGEVFEAFGFGEKHSTRVPVELIKEVKLSLKSGMLTDPNLSMYGLGGSYGWSSNLQPEEEDKAALQDFADALHDAIEERGPR